jgi:hypothetical protein
VALILEFLMLLGSEPVSARHGTTVRSEYLLTLTDNLTLLTLDLWLGSAHPYTTNFTQLTLALNVTLRPEYELCSIAD